MWKSIDGGSNYVQISTPHGDNHDLWIDPANPQRMIQGNDGGACVSLNGGSSWSTQFNQPTSQFYHVAADTRDPYTVYGTQQDNSSVAVPSRSPRTSITWSDCWPAGTGESGYIAVRPDDPDVIYVGAVGSSPGGGNSLQRYDHRARQIRLITTWPEEMHGEAPIKERYRFAWTYPIIISPHDPDTLYIGGNQVMRSTNEGQSWQEISPDLTRADPETLQPSGGPVNRESVGAETYATVFALAESPLAAGVAVGRLGRRPGAHHAGRGRHLDGNHAARAAGTVAHLHDRALAVRRWHSLDGRDALQTGRHAPDVVAHARLWRQLGSHQFRDARGRLHARHP